ncbi:MAG: hypothetical protein IJ024_04805 [Lachnospiraceae bacterium]|nr:hypothetical protein [Lachnospiraceae bacterium]
MKNHKNKSSASMEYDYLKPSSAQDCTGLIPAAPANDEEIENYEELYPFLPKVPVQNDSKNAPK